ncbi:MAG: GrxA family glutaredoxin [Hahellaceae bacterium]|jgi:glutaredoxin 1|nr:GrxA family glutaredoxin [Hahellaceae bacterium]
MHTTIYGRPACPYCVRAKQIAEVLKKKRDDFDYTYIDMVQAGISPQQLEEKIGQTVRTVPQILIDDTYIGGCMEFEAHARAHLGL